VPATVAPGELDGLRGRRVAVAALDGLGDYDAESTAVALAELGVKAAPVKAPMKGLPPGAALGDLFGRPAPAVRTTADLIAFPPGFVKLPKEGFELLAAAPSPHGWRLQKALEKALRNARVTVLEGEVTEFRRDGARLLAAVTRSDEVAGDAFVLATGRFIGGGLVKSRLVREPLLDLAVYYQGEVIEDAYPRLRHLEYLDPSPAFRTGLLTDRQLRPVDATGGPAFTNLRAAGSVLGGYDYAGGGCGFGLPLLTGRLAGRLAAAN
jgi:anaerobic glycerol-3-phosphate dehydrogenase